MPRLKLIGIKGIPGHSEHEKQSSLNVEVTHSEGRSSTWSIDLDGNIKLEN